MSLRLLVAMTSLLAVVQTPSLTPDPPKNCRNCIAWNRDLAPFAVFGNTFYVGTAELSAVLVTSPGGHVLIDAALPQSAPLIDAHIRALGFKTSDIKLILTSHAHYDHVGGVAALQRFTGATVAASPSSARALRQGAPTDDDPQKTIPDNGFPAVGKVTEIRDGEAMRVGALAITAHFTPGHTPGSTTWSWQSCDNGKCLNMVYADSLNAVSADDFKFTQDPRRVEAFRASIASVERLPCDVIVSVHPDASGLPQKLEARARKPTVDPFIDAGSCRAYAKNARQTLDARVASEKR